VNTIKLDALIRSVSSGFKTRSRKCSNSKRGTPTHYGFPITTKCYIHGTSHVETTGVVCLFSITMALLRRFHIRAGRRADIPLAGEIMYLQGRRLGDSTASGSKLPPFELSAMQARSYLAAINALSLVDKRNAWVSVPSTAGRSRRVSIALSNIVYSL